MRKQEELTDPSSCLNRAKDDELLFVLLGRDRAAPAAVRAWIDERIRTGKNTLFDPEIIDAGKWIAAVLANQPPTPSEVYHDRSDDSAWNGNGDLALLTGMVQGVLMQSDLWRVEQPLGYAPTFDLVKRDGRRFRFRVEEVTDPPSSQGVHP